MICSTKGCSRFVEHPLNPPNTLWSICDHCKQEIARLNKKGKGMSERQRIENEAIDKYESFSDRAKRNAEQLHSLYIKHYPGVNIMTWDELPVSHKIMWCQIAINYIQH